MNRLYLGDCLNVLRDNVPDESVDLVYIDPPFNSKRDYNIFFDDKEIQTQRIAFEDTWTLKNIQDSLSELHTLQTEKLYELLQTYQRVAPHAFPYLTMMSLRILELHRVLKPTGSFYLHCDPTMSHYLKTVCDIIFGEKNFSSEIIWRRTGTHNKVTRYAPIHDVILFYTKSEVHRWNGLKRPYMKGHIDTHFIKDKNGWKTNYYGNVLTGSGIRNGESGEPWRGYNPTAKKRHWAIPGALLNELDEDISHLSQHEKLEYLFNKGFIKITKGQAWPIYERYLKDNDGQPVSDLWAYQPYTEGTVFESDGGIDSDVKWLSPQDQERLGYPTQKPKALLERIIKASSNEGDTVLDGFSGCGTTVDAAEGLHRNWIGIDISPIAISLVKRRLIDTYGEHLSKFEVRGTPTDEQSAIELWRQNPNAFQDWWLTEFEVFSTTFGTKGPDKGVDGLAQYLVDPATQKVARAAFSVKGGDSVHSNHIDELRGAMEKHKCELGVFLTIAEPTKPMLDTIASSGFVEIPGYKLPRLQILTLKEYFKNKRPKLPQVNITFKAAQLKGKKKQNQIKMDM